MTARYDHLEHYTCECGTEVWRQIDDAPKLCMDCEDEQDVK